MIYIMAYIVMVLICTGLIYCTNLFDTDEVALSMILGVIWPITLVGALIIGVLYLPIWLVDKILNKS